LTGAFEFVFVASALFSVVGMYLFLKEFFGKIESIAGSLLYLYTPYRAVQIYVRGAMGEALAMAAIPFVFWAATRVINKPGRKNIFLLALFLAVLILSHNYIWLLVAPWIMLFCLVLLIKRKARIPTITRLFLGVILGAGLSAYWWIPSAKEYGLVAGITPFSLEDHFPFIKQLILPSWDYGASLPGPDDGMSFQIGIVNLAMVLAASAIILLTRKTLEKYGVILITSFSGFFVSVFFMNIRSLPVWRLLPIYEFVQFPWRLLFLTTFFSAVLATVVVATFTKRYRLWAALVVVVASIVLTGGYFKPGSLVDTPDSYYLSRMFATAAEEGERRDPTQDYVNWSEDYLLLPPGVVKSDHLPFPKAVGDGNVAVLSFEKVGTSHFKTSVDAGLPGKLSLYLLYFPGWYAKVDETRASISSGTPYGQLEVSVPSGRHEVEVYWAETPLRKGADYISLFSLVVGLGMVFVKGRKSNVLA
jgi:hypothetical protein